VKMLWKIKEKKENPSQPPGPNPFPPAQHPLPFSLPRAPAHFIHLGPAARAPSLSLYPADTLAPPGSSFLLPRVAEPGSPSNRPKPIPQTQDFLPCTRHRIPIKPWDFLEILLLLFSRRNRALTALYAAFGSHRHLSPPRRAPGRFSSSSGRIDPLGEIAALPSISPWPWRRF
jgi:hypothetical protein